MTTQPSRSFELHTLLTVVRWTTALAILLFGLTTVLLGGTEVSRTWQGLGLTLYASPILLQVSGSSLLRVGALWFGVFLVAQALLSPPVVNPDFKTLRKNDHFILDVKAGLPGISGPQEMTTDHLGFKTTKTIDYDSSETLRIFAVGGSTTQQRMVGNRKTWTHLMQSALESEREGAVEVVNTGVSGLRAQHHLATLERVVGYHPDAVIFLMGLNDWNFQIREHFAPRESWVERRATELTLKRTMLGQLILNLKNLGASTRTDDDVIEDYGDYYTMQRGSLLRLPQHRFRPESVHPQYEHHLNEISKVCHSSNVDCVFVTQPTGYQEDAAALFREGFWMTPPNEEYSLDFESMMHVASLYNRYLIEFSQRNMHSYCDIATALEPSYEFFIDDCHFNEAGSRKVAELLVACLQASD